MWCSPLAFYSPCWFPFVPFLCPLHLLGTLLAVTGSVHLGLRLLVNWPPLSQPFPLPSPLQIPSTQAKYAPHYDDFKNPASPVRNMYAAVSIYIYIRKTYIFHLYSACIKNSPSIKFRRFFKVLHCWGTLSWRPEIVTAYSLIVG
jgi:hypothetical protein